MQPKRFRLSVLQYSINEVLKSHIEQMRLSQMYLDKKTVFVYNISPKNLFYIIISRLYDERVIYHLHDPLPHKGYKRIPTFILQYFACLFASKVVVFSESLRSEFRRLYRLKTSCVVSLHGYPNELLVARQNKSEDYAFGWFGTFANYKFDRSFESCIELVKGKGDLLAVGRGYPDATGIDTFSGHMPNKEYYNLMAATRVIMVFYKDISYSGVIHDAVALGKHFLANDVCKDYILSTYSNYYLKTDFSTHYYLIPKHESKVLLNTWKNYVNEVFSI